MHMSTSNIHTILLVLRIPHDVVYLTRLTEEISLHCTFQQTMQQVFQLRMQPLYRGINIMSKRI
jgi:hypothetical protein